MQLKPVEFFETYGPAVVESTRGTGIFPSVKLAQMALETGFGKSIKVAANNAFGIKAGQSWTGKVVSNSTSEVLNGQRTQFKGSNTVYPNRSAAIAAGEHYQTLFRVYPSIAASIRDHSALLLRPRYAPALAAATPEEQAQLLESCGYATAQNYNESLVSLINKYNLKAWDKKKDS
jgi:flagellum-specific peptidoglycan hydrolase FlgJ